MNKEIKELIRKVERDAKIKTEKENQKFLNSWLRKGSYLRIRFDEELAKLNRQLLK